MKINYNNTKIVIYLPKAKEKTKQENEEFIKGLIIKLKKKHYKISGVYKVDVYYNIKYGLIIELQKEEEIDFFPDMIDLKINYYNNSEIYLEFADYFLINNYNYYKKDDKYYISINEISDNKITVLSDFFNVLYGKQINKIKFLTHKNV